MGTGPTYPLGRRNYRGVSGTRQIRREQARIGARSALGPRPHVVDRPRRHDAFGRDAEALGALAPERLHVELARGVGVGVDGEEAPEVAGQLDMKSLGCERAERLGIPAERIVTTWPVDDVRAWAKG